MIFWIFVIAALVSIIMLIVYEKVNDYSYASDLIFGFGITTLIISVVAILFMGTAIIVDNLTSAGTKSAMDEQYKALVYKMQTEECKDEFGIINKDYLDEIQKWNMNIAENKQYQRDFWIGIFIPNIYDDFETIDLKDISYRK